MIIILGMYEIIMEMGVMGICVQVSKTSAYFVIDTCVQVSYTTAYLSELPSEQW